MKTVHQRRFPLMSRALLIAGFCTLAHGSVQADAGEPSSLLPVANESATPVASGESVAEQHQMTLDAAPVAVHTDSDIEQQLAEDGSARVIVQLATDVEPEATLSTWQEVVERRAAITLDQNAVARALSGTDSTVNSRFQIVSAVAAEITPEGLRTLRSLPNVQSIELDIAVPPVLDGTVGIVEADEMWASGYTGSGYAVAVLDTGVQAGHPMFSDGTGGTRVVAEACYSTNSGSSIVSLCPGQVSQSVATGSGTNCEISISGCDHGTHVAGIAAGGSWSTGLTTISGVAPDAGIIAMQVFTKFNSSSACSPYSPPCVLSYSSDQLRALERVITLSSSIDIAAVNMSLGGGRHYSACDATTTIASAVETLAASGIATVIAAGNSGYSDSVASPACISSAVTVGSTTNGDLVSSFSNSAPNLIDVYAPGSYIRSAIPNNSSASYSGTSMAAPHVAGAFALIRNALPSATVDEIVAALRDTGTPVSAREGTDSLGYTHPRINIAQAVSAGTSPVLRVARDGNGTGSVSSSPAGIDCGNSCTTVVNSPTTFTLTATPSSGSSFLAWAGCDFVIGNLCTIEVSTASVAVTATFNAQRPDNDDFANADVVTSGIPIVQSTAAATAEGGEPSPSCDSGTTNSVWFTWTALSSGSVTVDTIGSDFDTVLAVYSDSDGTLAGLSEVDCDYGTAGGGWSDSTITFTATATTTYAVQVFGYMSNTGLLTLSLAATATSQQLDIAVSGDGVVTSDPSGIDCGENCVAEFPSGSTVTLTATAAAESEFIAWTGDCSSSTMVDTCVLSMGSAKSATAVFKAVVANDDYENSEVIAAVPFDQVVSTVGASRQTDEPESSCGAIGQSIWYSLTPSVPSTIAIDLSDSSFDTMVAVWAGDSLSTLSEIDCNDDYFGLQAYLMTEALSAGTTYHIQVGGYGGRSGDADVDVSEFRLTSQPAEVVRSTVGSAVVGSEILASGSCVDVSPALPEGLSIRADGVLTGTPTETSPFRRYAVLSWSGSCSSSPVEASVTSIDLVVNPTVAPDVALLTTTAIATLSTVEAFDTSAELSLDSVFTVTYPPGTFDPYEWVVMTAYSEPVVLGSVLSAGDGAASVELSLVSTIGLGDHNLVATGTVSQRAVRTPFSISDRSESFVALSSPSRIMDTRSGDKVGELDGSGSVRELQVTGAGGVPLSGVSAVALNVTAVSTETNDFGGFVTVFPCGTRPDSSNLNFTSGQTIPNSVIAPVSSDGKVCFYVYGKAHLLADVSGYFVSGFEPLTPSRIMDTRSGDKVGALDGSGAVRELQVTGAGGVPLSGVSAVALNVTAVSTETNDFGGFVTVFPCGTRPDASNLNFTSGMTIPNSVIAPVSDDGKVCFYVYGKAHLLADVSGYFVSGFEPLTPSRIMDTRSGDKVGALDGSGAVRELQVTGAGGVPLSGVSAVALNVTAVSTEANDFGGFVTVFPCGTRPDASNLNFTSGMTIPNSVIAPVSDDGKVCFYLYGKAHLLADVSGYLRN